MKFLLQLTRFIAVATTLMLGVALSISFGLNLFYYQELFPSYTKPTYILENLPPMELQDQKANPLNPKDTEHSPVVRINVIVDKKPKFICSGTVVSNKYVITAGHCITDREEGGIDKDKVFVIQNSSKTISVDSKAVAMHPSMDYGLLMGDFTVFQKLELDPVSLGFSGKLGPFVTCGFPLGGIDHCQAFPGPLPFIGYQNAIGKVQLYPGMSGGPVMDLTTGYIVGINSAVGQDYSVFSPIVNFFGVFDIEIK